MPKRDSQCIACGTAMDVLIPEIWDDRYGHPGVFTVMGCRSCGELATVPPLTEADLPALYSTYYPRREINLQDLEREAALVTRQGAALRRWWAGTDNQGHYLAKPGQTVLDVGSGSCLSLLEMRALGIDGRGVETDPNVQLIAEHFGLEVHIGSIHDDPFPGMLFDLVTLSQVIEHIPEPKAMLAAIRLKLAAEGRVVLAFPNADSLYRRLFGRRWINWHIPFHQHFYTRRSIALLAEQEGFHVENVRTVTPNLWTALQLRTLSGVQRGEGSSAWGSGTDKARNKSMVKKLALIGLRFAGIGIGMVNRVIDASGNGDSLVVVLKMQPEQ